jgi:hypothetical protein
MSKGKSSFEKLVKKKVDKVYGTNEYMVCFRTGDISKECFDVEAKSFTKVVFKAIRGLYG